MQFLQTSYGKRLVSGIIMAVILVACLWAGGWPLRLLMCVVTLAGLWEFYQLYWPGKTQLVDKGTGLLLGAILCLYVGALPKFSFFSGVLALYMLFLAVHYLIDYGRGHDQPTMSERALFLFGLVYIPVGLNVAMDLSLAEQGIVIMSALGSDTGAYYSGSKFGKHKICPRVSPNKSWEGALGGAAVAIIAVVLIGTFATIPGLENTGVFCWALVGLLLSISGQIGDFFESALKRTQGVKDSSNLIPGHGGVLDRIDSLLFALPVYAGTKFLIIFVS